MESPSSRRSTASNHLPRRPGSRRTPPDRCTRATRSACRRGWCCPRDVSLSRRYRSHPSRTRQPPSSKPRPRQSRREFARASHHLRFFRVGRKAPRTSLPWSVEAPTPDPSVVRRPRCSLRRPRDRDRDRRGRVVATDARGDGAPHAAAVGVLRSRASRRSRRMSAQREGNPCARAHEVQVQRHTPDVRRQKESHGASLWFHRQSS